MNVAEHNTVATSDHRVFTYAQIRARMRGESWTMELASPAEIKTVIDAVNQGIDSHLEACNCPERGDTYIIKRNGRRLECVVSVESFPTLLRRLYEMDTDESNSLADDMLMILFRED